MKTMNKTQLIGYLGKDPVIKECKNGNVMAMFQLATHERKPDAQQDSSNESYKTIWHNIAVWGEGRIQRLNNLIKGSHIMVEGKLEYQRYPDKHGHMRYYTCINAYSFTDLDR